MKSATFLLALVGASCLYIAACLFLYMIQTRLIFPGAFLPFPVELENLGRLGGLDAVEIRASDGEKLFTFRQAPVEGMPVIILFHGNASYPEAYGFLYANWIAAGYGIIAPAARGYPRSSGQADGEKMLSDALDIYDWTAKAYPGHSFYAVGQSLGTAPAIHLASRRKVASVVLISPFKSMLSLVSDKLPFFPIALLLKATFRSDLDMAKVEAPMLVLHGDRDELVPLASARALVSLAKTKVEFAIINGAGHANGMFTPATINRIDAFIGESTP